MAKLKHKPPQSPGGKAVRQSAVLGEILDELHSPEEFVRAEAVRKLCPCRTAWDVPVQRYLAEMRDDPSSTVRHEIHHVFDEDSSWGKKLEQKQFQASLRECTHEAADPGSQSLGWYKKRKPLRKRISYPQNRSLQHLLRKTP
jgi:hypothetical protein